MVLNLRHLESFPATLDLKAEAGEIPADFEGLQSIDGVTAQLTVNKSDEEFFVNGTVKAGVTIQCSRCLGWFSMQVETLIDFIACAAGLHGDNKEIIDDEDYAYFGSEELEVDVSEVVRQAIVVMLPMKPLCSEECRGLCASCGNNLNKTECDCVKDKIDGRWEALRKISDQTNNEARG